MNARQGIDAELRRRLECAAEVGSLLRVYGLGSEVMQATKRVLDHERGEKSPLVAIHNEPTRPEAMRTAAGRLLSLMGRLYRSTPLDARGAADRIELLVTQLNQHLQESKVPPAADTPPPELLAVLTKQEAKLLLALWERTLTFKALHQRVWKKPVQDDAIAKACRRLADKLTLEWSHVATLTIKADRVTLTRPDK